MKNTRREFIRRFSAAATLITVSGFQSLQAEEFMNGKDAVKLRLIIASDAHYGQPDTPFKKMSETFVEKANAFHQAASCDFCVLNGDIIHNEAKFMPIAKRTFDKLNMPLYATQGNHDHVTPMAWEEIWGMPVNHTFSKKGYKIILTTTSNEAGEYLSPNLPWLSNALEKAKDKSVLLFVHIPQTKWTRHAIETPAFFELLSKHKNVKAVFHGHEHEEDGIYIKNEIPFVFDSHIGGSWGTDYKGFRVVEVMKNGNIVTYMMNPDVEISRDALYP
ncbi:MAG: putative phosphodiesterase [Arcticibacterium sp.]|jgi:predicted phosphodiesterase